MEEENSDAPIWWRKLHSNFNDELEQVFAYEIKIDCKDIEICHMTTPVSRFGPFDYIREVKEGALIHELLPGEYYISRNFSRFKRGFYPLNFVRFAFDKEWIQSSDITYGIVADRHILPDAFNRFMNRQTDAILEDIVNDTHVSMTALQRQLICQYVIDSEKEGNILNIQPSAMHDYYHQRPKVMKIHEDADGEYINTLRKSSALVMGMPGCGKSEALLKIVDETSLVLSFTHAAVQNLVIKGIEDRARASTFQSAIWNPQIGKLDIEKFEGYTRVVIDEYTMMPPNNMRYIYDAWKQYGFQVVCFGDPDQCPAPVDNWVSYHTNPLFLKMCGHLIVEMQYKDGGKSRYDHSLYTALRTFKSSGTLIGWRNQQEEAPITYKHIVYTNRKRKELNDICFARWANEHRSNIVSVCEGFPICIGLSVMVYHGTNRQLGLFKTQEWKIVEIHEDSEKITIQRDAKLFSISYDDFIEYFDYAFAITAHKSQGITIREKYTVHETSIMTWEIAYTALSRGVSLSNVYVDSINPNKVLHHSHRAPSIPVKTL